MPVKLQQQMAPEAREDQSGLSPSADDEPPGPSDLYPSGAHVDAEPSTSDHPTDEHAAAEFPQSEATAEGQKKKQSGLHSSLQERQPGYIKKGMKEKKKEFLKNRKLKKKGGKHGEEEELEAQLAQDPHKPKFGEQAMAPIKVGNNWGNRFYYTILLTCYITLPTMLADARFHMLSYICHCGTV